MVSISVYDEVADFIARMNPSNVIKFKPSRDNQKRFDFLLEKHKETDLSNEEKSELEHFLILNRIIGLAKARALNLLANEER
ncbi:MAG: hypothetical protein ACTHKY_06005 [Ginsengibacter sp.]